MTHRVHVLPDDLSLDLAEGETILSGSLRVGIAHAHACGGKARCSTCRVVVEDGLEACTEPNERERQLVERIRLGREVRLACQTTVRGDVRVRRPVLDEVDLAVIDGVRRGRAAEQVGEEKHVAILFADINGYTPFVEKLPAYDVTHVLNRYFYLVGDRIHRNGGFISDYVGDGILALFGMEGEPEPARGAVQAALEMFAAVEEMNPWLEQMYGRRFDIRVGVHVGTVVVGTIGLPPLVKVAAIGDPVNVASRIESTNKELGTRFLASAAVVEEVGEELELGPSCDVTLKGHTGVHRIHEVAGLRGWRPGGRASPADAPDGEDGRSPA